MRITAMRIDNSEEFDAAQQIVSDAEKVAAAIWRWKYPDTSLPAGHQFHASFFPERQAAWSLACDIADGYTGSDPDAAAEAVNDWLRDQIDPCGLDKAARLDAA
jgi:hypothetical protein